MLAVGCGDGTIRIFDPKSGEETAVLKQPGTSLPINALSWRPERYVARGAVSFDVPYRVVEVYKACAQIFTVGAMTATFSLPEQRMGS